MQIQYLEPLSRAWGRMTTALFRPVDPGKWIAVGFTAFLSGLTQCGGSSAWQWNRGDGIDWDDAMTAPHRAWEWIFEHPFWLAAGVVLLLFFLAVGIALLWVSSRGKFMFLDNVVHDRALVAHPWGEYRTEGNSLFLWTLGYSLVALAVLLVYLAGGYASLYALYEERGDAGALLFPALALFAGLVAIVVLANLVDLCLRDFVVPIMYRFRLPTLRAWGVFVPLLAEHFLAFAGYFLLLLAIHIAVAVLAFLAGCLTCCIGFLLLAIPYVGTLVLLPLLYALRAFSVEFLEQFGPDYRFFPPREAPAGPDGTRPPDEGR
jgi:hypothetical protein